MPIAAVPAYLGNDFKDATPGMRFGMLLPIWTSREDQVAELKKRAEAKSREGQQISELLQRQGIDALIRSLCNEDWCRQQRLKPLPGRWEKNDFAARRAWGVIEALNPSDQERMKHLALRQTALAATIPADNLLRLEATATAPFTTGLGNEHPLENGFAFLNPYGLPYLAGSGVKGVLRQAARELASGAWGDTHGWSAEKNIPLMAGEGERRRPVLDDNKRPVTLSVIDVLFGLESGDGDTEHVRGALAFWDVIPQIAGDSLMVEIMTPHQGHYYQWKKDRHSNPIEIAPHDSGQPNPIAFLTVPPGSRFAFHVVCDRAHLARLVPGLATGDGDGRPRWQHLLQAAFEHAFQWLGFGAKTAVGYGTMETEAMRARRLARAQEWHSAQQAAEAKRREEEAVANAEAWPGARLKFNRANRTLTAEKDGKSAHALAPKGEQLLATLPPDMRSRVESNQFVTATAVVLGRTLLEIKP